MTNIYPQPQKIEFLSKTLTRPSSVSIKCDKQLENVAENLTAYFQNIGIACNETAEYVVELNICDSIVNVEGYELLVEQKATKIWAKCEAGVFYGIQTLKQLFVERSISCCSIVDEPRYNFRGFMIDVGRYFYTVAEVFTMINWCASYKLNVLHMHLTEDQGFRVQIDKYPRLTEIGSKRTHTNFNCRPHQGFYTKADIKKIVDYAHKNHMIVIPEFEIPGHARAAISAYPELSCFDRKLPVATHWGVKHDIMCAGKDFTYKFCYDVIDEFIEMFPDGYLHIGGDEAPKTRWNLCPHCQKIMKEKDIKNVDELQGYMTKKMVEYISTKNYKSIAWFDSSCGEINNKDLIYQWWGGSEISEQIKNEIANGSQYINSNSGAYYIDLPYGKIPLSNTYNTPVKFSNLENSSSQHGLIATLWTEMISNMKRATHMTFPRLLAFAEKCWTNEENLSYETFVGKLEDHRKYLNTIKVKMPKKRIYQPSKCRGFFQKMWFERRQLYWEGLTNIIDNSKVEKMAKKLK